MRLLECHIANFGAFSDYNLTFEDGLNVVMQPNGWGKTTLAAFVKAMLYGFGTKRIRDVRENERLRYRPWQGGTYGGTLDFEHDGKQYRIIRTFGDTARFGDCKVMELETGKKCSEIGDNVGEWLFGLDAGAFQKSVFITGQGMGSEAGESGLRTRLNALVNEADDVSGLDKALAKLDSRRKFYKKTGNRGQIDDVSREISKLLVRQKSAEESISEIERMRDGVASTGQAIEKFDAQIAAAKEALSKARSASSESKSVLKVQEQLAQQAKEAKAKYEKASAEVGSVPTAPQIEEISKQKDQSSKTESATGALKARVSELEREKNAIARKYSGTLPNAEDAQAHRKLVDDLTRVEGSLNEQKHASDLPGATSAFTGSPDLVSQSESLLKSWPAIEESQKKLEELEREKDLLSAQANERAPEAPIASKEEIGAIGSSLEACKRKDEAERSAKTRLKSAEELLDQRRSVAADAEARVDEDRRAVESAPSVGSPAPGIVCIALGVICAIVGIALGPASVVSLGAYGLAAVLIVVGAALLSKRSSAEKSKPKLSETLLAACDKASSELESQKLEVDTASADWKAKSEAARSEREALRAALGEYFPSENLDLDSIVFQAPVLVDKLKEASETADRVSQIESRILSIDSESAQLSPSVAAYGEELHRVVAKLGLDGEGADLSLLTERLRQAVANFERNSKLIKERADKLERAEREIASIRDRLNSWAASMGLGGMAALSASWFEALDADIQANKKLEWDIETAEARRKSLEGEKAALDSKIAAFCSLYGFNPDANLEDQLASLQKRTAEIESLKVEADTSAKQLRDYAGKNAQAIRKAKAASSQDGAIRELDSKIALAQKQRESFVRDKAQQGERLAQVQRALETYPSIQHEIRQLTAKRQKSIANLFTITKTAELLQQARKNLDGRYLGFLGNRFNDYADAWLVEDELQGEVDEKFNIAITSSAGTHDALNYSTGYCDIIDMSLRLALVDVLFEKDKPFLIMDDPFASLDAKKISTALALLAAL